jgi:aspartate aminotransferase
MVDTLQQLHLSTRAQQMPSSPIRRLVPFQEQAQAKGIKVYPLNIGQPDVPTPPEFFEALRQKMPKVVEYTHSAGLASYRKQLVKYYSKFAAELKMEDILVTCGGSEALRFAFMACLNPGDEVIVIEPCYANYIGFAVEAGVQLVPVTTYVEQDFALPPASAIEAVITEKTKAILLCNPANPTGKLYSAEELNQIKAIVLQHHLYWMSDEVYSEFAYDESQPFISALSYPEVAQNVIICDSISKRYSGCGARIGTFVSRNAAVVSAALKFAQARLSPPLIGQIGAEVLVDLPASYYAGIVELYRRRLNLVRDALSKMPGVKCPSVSGAFYIVPQLPIDDADRFCQWLLESFSYQNQTVMMAPATGFYVTPGLGKNEVRIAYVLEEAELAHAMEALAQGLLAYPGRTV